ncbi:unnamed protein product [Kuraishia capsulata CBS 1993]|uniref:RNA helicase n=1 Tax=Kuraishia capsulata CBS 1993 TaxID=1382522 RepID=W6MQ60_9ASCO|nr:uncharacterized protein KUCA_T00004859001 [Kuraishia capsulata CBS 1993]CDK28874.1 unnamed protein product [Kuraishia capsulata CBS 1993]
MAKKGKTPPKTEPAVKDSKKVKKTSPPEPEPAKPKTGRDVVASGQTWTGKLPGSLLHEHCQKQRWEKVTYDMRHDKSGYLGIVNLAWKNPKTQEVITVQMVPPRQMVKPQETSLEARHFAATYALHRIAFEKNLSMVLPTNHKHLWSDLEKERKKLLRDSPDRARLMYTPDPFGAILEQRKEEERKRKEEAASLANAEKARKPTISIVKATLDVKQTSVKRNNKFINDKISFPRKAWASAPFIDLKPQTRELIEFSIKHHINWTQDVSSKRDTSYTEFLLQLGFRKPHVEESIKYTHTFVDSLEWLIFHIPDDDLPGVFAKGDKDSAVAVTLSKDIKRSNMARRLADGGFSKSEVEFALDRFEDDEAKAAVYLSKSLLSLDEMSLGEIDAEESAQLFKDEIEGLHVIYEQKFNVLSDSIVEINIEPQGLAPNLLALKVFKSTDYPLSLPGMALVVKNQSYSLASYIKLSAIKHLQAYALENRLVGDCMIWPLVEWIEENLHGLIENPGPLFNPRLNPKSEPGSSQDEKTSNASSKKRSRSRRLNEPEIKKRYLERQCSEKLKVSLKGRASLPAWSKQEDLVSMITTNRVSLVTGETGSGKSTQIVQFLLDHLSSEGDFKSKIVCTQPRRISALGLADRVSEERCEECGQETGYIIRGENKTGPTTRLTFVTTGVLLRMVQGVVDEDTDASVFSDLSYIFIDEVHERSVDSDLLLIILKTMLPKYPKLKVVLMSATIESSTFDNYFGGKVPHSHIKGRTFPIEDMYLEDIIPQIGFTIKSFKDDGEIITPGPESKFFQLGNINYDLIGQLVGFVDQQLKTKGNNGSILIFLPGVMEITRCIRTIEQSFTGNCKVLPLHSALSSKDQKRIFVTPPKGVRKIVVSTNVAETSITIPDVVVVIDSGRAKSMMYDPKMNSTKLLESWCSRAEVNQRRGRAGRVTSGMCYRLFTKKTMSEQMLAQPIPEIKRTRLENVYLVVKAIGIKNVSRFLAEGLDPPAETTVAKAAEYLSEIGALHNSELTNLGRYLSILPTDLKSGKLLIFGTLFGALETCLTIAAISVSGNPFITRVDTRDEVKNVQTRFSMGKGDLMAVVNALDEYAKLGDASYRKKSQWLDENFLSQIKIRELLSTKSQYLSTLKDLGFVPLDYGSGSKSFKYLNRANSNYRIIKAIITSAAYPDIARVQLPDPKFTTSASGAVATDPDAKQIKLWIRNEEYMDYLRKEGTAISKEKDEKPYPSNRAFIHPSSSLFTKNEKDIQEIRIDESGNYDLKPKVGSKLAPTAKISFLSFGSASETSKLYLRDITPSSILSVLLFGGEISYDLRQAISGNASPGIVLDGWLPVRTWCKNAVLIKHLRSLLDEVIRQKLSNPHYQDGKDSSVGDDVLEAVEQILNVEVD